MTSLLIRPMRRDEVAIAIDWAAAEGWNPGLGDAACFVTVDPEGFLIGEIDGEPVATISCINYDAAFSFLGFYIVRKDLRGRGIGLQIWNAAIAHAGNRNIGLDGVTAQRDNYLKSGFQYAYANIRYGGTPGNGDAPKAHVLALRDIPIALVEADDACVFPAARPAFLRHWISAASHTGRAVMRDGKLVGWGVIRSCRSGHKIGPLFAADRSIAEDILSALVHDAGGGMVFLDAPAVNPDAVALAESCGLHPVFETARMYTQGIPPLRVERIFGVTTFELG